MLWNEIVFIILIAICIDGDDFFIVMLTGYFFTALHIFKIGIPIRYSTYGWFDFQYFLSQHRILMLDRFISLSLSKSTIFTNSLHLDIKMIVTWVASLSHYPTSVRIPDIEDIINQILIILHLRVLFHQGMRARSGWRLLLSETCYGWFGMLDIIIMPGFVLEIYKLLCSFYLHIYL